MSIITFTSDLGKSDQYVAEAKGAIWTENPDQTIVDISHLIAPHDIDHAAYVVRHSYSDFPKGTVHLIDVNPFLQGDLLLVAIFVDGHYFVSYDTGIFHLIHSYPPTESIALNASNHSLPRTNLAVAAAKIAQGEALSSLGQPQPDLLIRINWQVKVTKKEIVGHVIHIDHFGNLITNIKREYFDTIVQLLGGDPEYVIRFGLKRFGRFHKNYGDVERKEIFVLFNSYGFLEIGINGFSASDNANYGLEMPVIIEFNGMN